MVLWKRKRLSGWLFCRRDGGGGGDGNSDVDGNGNGDGRFETIQMEWSGLGKHGVD